MSESLWIAIISASAALLGGIIGYIAAEIQATRSFNRQSSLEIKKREWSIQDDLRKHRISVLMKRCDEVEEFVYTYAEDFQNIRHASLFILQSTDQREIQTRINEYGRWRDAIPKRVYAYGASVSSLGRPDLVKYWNEMNEAWQLNSDLYKAICSAKEKDPGPYQYHARVLADIDKSYQDFNNSLGHFLSQLDEVRALSKSGQSDKPNSEE